MFDVDGALFITGRLKELINRGGEKISPSEIDEALSRCGIISKVLTFGVPCPKYGEAVEVAVELGVTRDVTAAEEILAFAREKLTPHKVPRRVHIVAAIPTTASGKVSRAKAAEMCTNSWKDDADMSFHSGSAIACSALRALGVRRMFGVTGVPIVDVADEFARKNPSCFIGMRNEQSGCIAAATYGFLTVGSTGVPGVCLSVGGPGFINSLAGLAHAQQNKWPMLLICGGVRQRDVGSGAFQELNQHEIAGRLGPSACKASFTVTNAGEIPEVLDIAARTATEGIPGGVFVNLPADVLLDSTELNHEAFAHHIDVAKTKVQDIILARVRRGKARPVASAEVQTAIHRSAELLQSAKAPLIIAGEVTAMRCLGPQLTRFAEVSRIPVFPVSMARGVIPDDHQLNVGSARSAAFRECDVVVLIGADPAFRLHYLKEPYWKADVRAISVEPTELSRSHPKVEVVVDAVADLFISETMAILAHTQRRDTQWHTTLENAKRRNEDMLAQALMSKSPRRMGSAGDKSILRSLRSIVHGQKLHHMKFTEAFSVIRSLLIDADTMGWDVTVVAEGANTLDFSRRYVPVFKPLGRLDVGVWGTMGVGPACCIAAHAAAADAVSLTKRRSLIIALEGDSAFGFSGMECETLARLDAPVLIIVFNNSGVYGRIGERDDAMSPRALLARASYDLVMKGCGGSGAVAATPKELEQVIRAVLEGQARLPLLVDTKIDPRDGSVAGRLSAFQ
eukprot:Polyplicarium_translucidae@DN2098_c0_g1_i2.p1